MKFSPNIKDFYRRLHIFLSEYKIIKKNYRKLKKHIINIYHTYIVSSLIKTTQHKEKTLRKVKIS